MVKWTETKKALHIKMIHNLDIWQTNYPKRCPPGLHTAAVRKQERQTS